MIAMDMAEETGQWRSLIWEFSKVIDFRLSAMGEIHMRKNFTSDIGEF